jgi:hypothetical protein
MSEKISEGEIDLIVITKLNESGWKIKDNMTYHHTYAPGRIFPKEEYKYGRETPFSPEFVLNYKPEDKNAQSRVLAVVEDKPVSDRQLDFIGFPT